MPELVKLYIRNVLIGFWVAALFVAMLFWLNVMNLWTLISNHPDGILATFLLWFMNGIVFAGVQFAYAIMQMAQKEEGPHGGKPVRQLVPATLPVQPARKSGKNTVRG